MKQYKNMRVINTIENAISCKCKLQVSEVPFTSIGHKTYKKTPIALNLIASGGKKVTLQKIYLVKIIAAIRMGFSH